jgi:hypothetical protein
MDFWATWCPKDSPVLGIIQHGLRLDFVSQPPTTSNPSPVVLPQDSAKASAHRVESLLDKGAIVHIDNRGPGFYSHIFVVPKKQKGSWRLIIDLSRLNRFLRVPHFKVEPTRSIAAVMLPAAMCPPPDRIVKIMSRVIRQLSAPKFCQAREFLSLIGLLNSAADQFPQWRLYLRPLQLLLLSRWRPHRDPLDREIPLPDASNFGLGAHVNEVDLSTDRTWSREESKMSINILELKVVLLGVKHFRSQLKIPESVSVYGQFHGSGLHSKTGRYPLPSSLQNDMGTSPVLPSREHSTRPTAYTGEVQLLADALSKQASLHGVDTIHMDIVQAVRDL